jgi:hypothetical protein
MGGGVRNTRKAASKAAPKASSSTPASSSPKKTGKAAHFTKKVIDADGEDRTPLTLAAATEGASTLEAVFSSWGVSAAAAATTSADALENMGILTPLVSTLIDRSLLSSKDDVHHLVPTPAARTVEETAASLGGVVLIDEEEDASPGRGSPEAAAAESKKSSATISVSVGVGVDMDELDEEELAELAARAEFLAQRLDLSEAEQAQPVEIVLEETDTHTLFYLPSLCVSFDNTQSHDAVTTRNATYEQRCRDTQAADAADMFGSHEVQTFNSETVAAYVQTSLPESADAGETVQPWMLYDAFLASQEEASAALHDEEVAKPINSADVASGPASDVSAIVARAARHADLELGTIDAGEAAAATMESDPLLQSLLLAERVLAQNLFHPKVSERAACSAAGLASAGSAASNRSRTHLRLTTRRATLPLSLSPSLPSLPPSLPPSAPYVPRSPAARAAAVRYGVAARQRGADGVPGAQVRRAHRGQSGRSEAQPDPRSARGASG